MRTTILTGHSNTAEDAKCRCGCAGWNAATLAGRVEAAFDVPSAGAFFNALDGADKAASDANFNTLLAATAKAPISFGQCVCGSQYSVADSRIVMNAGEREAAAVKFAAWRGHQATAAPTYRAVIEDVIDAINAAREQADVDFIADWNSAHTYCMEEGL